jgi:hypothetical protein
MRNWTARVTAMAILISSIGCGLAAMKAVADGGKGAPAVFSVYHDAVHLSPVRPKTDRRQSKGASLFHARW